MAIAGTVAAIAGTAVSAVGTVEGISAQNKAAKAQQQANQLQQQQADLQQQQQKNAAIRQSRIAYANAQSAATNQGVADSSAAQGGEGSIQSQAAGNQSFLDTAGNLSDLASASLGKAASAKADASLFSTLGSLGQTISANSDRIGNFFGTQASNVGFATGFKTGTEYSF